ncbi:sensor histidine kinase [Phenylobacterium sp.]|uniref:sensor histidine kinase n=1 Tax=Phenylobacterium sp. TaxID=1871053 RepID=UPI0035B155E1
MERLGTGVPDTAWSILLRRADRGLILVDRRWRVRFCSPVAQRELLRQPAAEGANFWDHAGRFFDAATRRRFRRALSHATPAEAVLSPAPGLWLHVELVCDTEVSAVLARDATRDLRLQAAARRMQERTRELNESLMLAHRAARAATWEWRAGEALRWTDVDAARDLIGIPRPWSSALVPRDWVDLVVPEDRPGLQQAVSRVRADGEGQFVFRVVAADGAVRWLEASAVVAERGPAGEALRLAGVTIDVTQRRAAEDALQQEVAERRRAEERQRLLVAELNHRVKNTLATVQSIARQTLRSRPELRRLFEDFEGRLLALSWAHDVLNAEGWSGADLPNLVEQTLRAHQGDQGDRIIAVGPAVRLAPEVALAISLALHELATNALKYGAFARDEGFVEVRWDVGPVDQRGEVRELTLEWRERNGPAVTAPTRSGFGTRLLRQALSAELGAPVDLRFEPDGLVCRLSTRRGLLPAPAAA